MIFVLRLGTDVVGLLYGVHTAARNGPKISTTLLAYAESTCVDA